MLMGQRKPGWGLGVGGGGWKNWRIPKDSAQQLQSLQCIPIPNPTPDDGGPAPLP